MGDLVTTEQAAQVLGLSQSRVRAMLRSGELAGERDRNGPWRINEDSVRAEVERRSGGAVPAVSGTEHLGGADGDDLQDPFSDTGSVGDDTGSRAHRRDPVLERIAPPPIRRRLRRSRLDRESLKWYHGGEDDQENRDSEPPPDETVLLRSFWTAEVYTPATVHNLRAALERLGRSRTGTSTQEPGHWVDGVRSRPSMGSWSTLGRGHRASVERMSFGRGFHLELPDSVKEVDLSLFSVGPATTVLMAGFLFEPDAARCLDDVLRTTYSTYVDASEENPNWRAYHTPANQKRAAVAAAVDDLRRDCSAVIRATFPGGLCVDEDEPHPGILVMTTERTVPLADDGRGAIDDYRMIARIQAGWSLWQTEAPGPWRFESDWLQWEEARGLALVAARRSDVEDPEALRMYGGGEHALDYSLNHCMRGLACRWVLLDYLARLHRRLGAQRDQLARDTRSSGSIKHLERLRRELVDTTMDARAATEDIRLLAEDERVYKYDVWDFAGSDPSFPGAAVDGGMRLAESLRRKTVWQADRVNVSQQAVSDLLTVDANLRGSISNLHLQRTLRWLALLALLIAVVNVAVVAFGLASG